MNTDLNSKDSAVSRPPRRRKSKVGRNVTIIVILVLLGCTGALAVWGPQGAGGWARGLWAEETGLDAGKVHTVTRGPLTISIRQSGTIHHRDKVIVKSKLEGSSTVIWIIDEGKPVEVGDLLLELDSSGFEQKKELQDIVVINSEASLISAREALAVTRNDSRTAIDDAKLAIHLAELDLKKYVGERVYTEILAKTEAEKVAADRGAAVANPREAALMSWLEQVSDNPEPFMAPPDIELYMDYDITRRVLDYAKALVKVQEHEKAIEEDPEEEDEKAVTKVPKKKDEGDYPQLVKEAKAAITIARSKLKQAEERVEWSVKLEKDGHLTSTELDADKLDAEQARLNRDIAESKLEVLKRYTRARNVAELVNDLGKAKRALDPIKRKAAADIKQAEAKLKASESEHKQQLALQAKAESQIKECRVYAPVAGKVVYASTTSHHWRHSSEPLAEGSTVYERRELFHMPGKDKIMMSVVKIPQASLKKVLDDNGLVRPLPARITIAEAKDKYFPATLAKVAPMPDNIPWYRGDQSIKVFATEVHLNEVHPDLSAGFRCEVEIIVAQYEDVLSIPLQAVTTVRGKSTVYVRQAGQTVFKPRMVELGLDNNRVVHVLSGLSAGEEVLLEPPLDQAKTDKDENGANGGRKAATTRPAGRRRGEGAGAPKDLRSMTPEQRKKAFEKMTPEQKAALRKRMKQMQDGGDKGGGRPGGSGAGKSAGGGRGRP